MLFVVCIWEFINKNIEIFGDYSDCSDFVYVNNVVRDMCMLYVDVFLNIVIFKLINGVVML